MRTRHAWSGDSGPNEKTESDTAQGRKGGRPDILGAWCKAIDLLLLLGWASFESAFRRLDPGYRKEKIVRADPRYL